MNETDCSTSTKTKKLVLLFFLFGKYYFKVFFGSNPLAGSSAGILAVVKLLVLGAISSKCRQWLAYSLH